MSKEKDAQSEQDDTVWPPPPTSSVPTAPKPLGLWRSMADVPFWALPIVTVSYVLMFTGIYLLALHPGHHPVVLVDALIRGPGFGLLLSSFFLCIWLCARKRRRDNPEG